MLDNGFFPGEDMNDVHPDIISRYYGADRDEIQRQPDQSGAGHSDDEGHSDDGPGSDDEMLEAEPTGSEDPISEEEPEDDETHHEDIGINSLLANDQDRHVRHPPIPVPDNNSPFLSGDNEELFFTTLQQVRQSEIVPPHYGLRDSEWGPGLTYSDTEDLLLGRARRRLSVELPPSIWWLRAVYWAQAHSLLTEMLMEQSGEI